MAEDVCHYTVEVREVEGLENLAEQSMPAVLSSMSDGANIYLRSGSTIPASRAFSLKGAEQQRLLSDEFLTFGEDSEANHPHTLTLLVRQADNTPAKPVAGGFIVNVESWNENTIPVPMTPTVKK